MLLDHEKARVEQEKTRVETLLNGLQNSMNIYNAGGNPQINKANDAVVPKQMPTVITILLLKSVLIAALYFPPRE